MTSSVDYESVIPMLKGISLSLHSSHVDSSMPFMVDSVLALLKFFQHVPNRIDGAFVETVMSQYAQHIANYVQQRAVVTYTPSKSETSLVTAIGPDLCAHIISFMSVDSSILPLLYVCKTFNLLASKALWKTVTANKVPSTGEELHIAPFKKEISLKSRGVCHIESFKLKLMMFDVARLRTELPGRINALKTLECEFLDIKYETVMGHVESWLTVHSESLRNLHLEVDFGVFNRLQSNSRFLEELSNLKLDSFSLKVYQGFHGDVPLQGRAAKFLNALPVSLTALKIDSCENMDVYKLSKLKNLRSLDLFGFHVCEEHFSEFWKVLTRLSSMSIGVVFPVLSNMNVTQLSNLKNIMLDNRPRNILYLAPNLESLLLEGVEPTEVCETLAGISMPLLKSLKLSRLIWWDKSSSRRGQVIFGKLRKQFPLLSYVSFDKSELRWSEKIEERPWWRQGNEVVFNRLSEEFAFLVESNLDQCDHATPLRKKRKI
jgi:hypothetical protein